MTHIEVEIEGRTPLLVHRFTDAQQIESSNGSRTATVGDRGTPREQAEASLYYSNDGKTLILPAMNIYSSIVGGGSFFKAGKSKVTTQKTSLLFACFEIEELELPIIHKEPWTVDTRPVRMPSTGGRVLRHRPSFHDWRLNFTGRLDESVMTVHLLREIVDAAGVRVGLGDYRPSTKGPFGKFHVISWQAEKLAPASTKKGRR